MKRNLIFKSLCWLAVIAFGCEGIDPQSAGAQAFISRPNLSAAGELLPLNAAYTPVMIRGMKFNPVDGLNMSFIVDTGNTNPDEIALKQESEKLIKYFLASLAIPEKDLWVNLSPYEKDRITSLALSRTDMGRDLLAQDYILKTITSALIDPNNETGRKFWDKVYDRLYNVGAIHELPLQETIDSFNKVWIMPDKAEVFAQGNTVLILNSRLKVMLEEDYFAKQLSLRGATGDEAISEIASSRERQSLSGIESPKSQSDFRGQKTLAMTEDVKQIMREVVVPMIEDEVNSGENFAPLRQIFHALILAKWFKENLKESLLGKVYADRSKISGIDIDGKPAIDAIYSRYVEAFKAGAEGLLKEEYDPATQEIITRKYMTGGFISNGMPIGKVALTANEASLAVPVKGMLKEVTISLGVKGKSGLINPAMLSRPPESLSPGAIQKWINKYEDALEREDGYVISIQGNIDRFREDIETAKREIQEIRAKNTEHGVATRQGRITRAENAIKREERSLKKFMARQERIKGYLKDLRSRPASGETEPQTSFEPQQIDSNDLNGQGLSNQSNKGIALFAVGLALGLVTLYASHSWPLALIVGLSGWGILSYFFDGDPAMMTDWERADKALRSAQKKADRIRGDVTAVGKKIPGLEILAKKPNAKYAARRTWQRAVRQKSSLEKELSDQEKLVELYQQRLNDLFNAAMMTPNHFEEDGVPEEGFAKGGIDLNTGEMEFKSGGRVDRAVLNQFQNINPDDIIGVVPLNIIIKPVLSMQSFLGIEKP